MRLSNRQTSEFGYFPSRIRPSCSLWWFLAFYLSPACLVCSDFGFAADRPSSVSSNIGCARYESFVRMDTSQLTERATHREEPDSKLLDNAGVHATVIVRVFVNKKGRVVCDRIVGDANPFLGKLALEAARAWTFEPLLQGGHLRGMQGDLVFHIER